MPAPQTYDNHVRFDPLWHFFVMPVLMLNVVFAAYATVRHWHTHAHLYTWWTVVSVVLFLAVGKARGHSARVQDRIIRLEERLRLAALLSAEDNARSYALTEAQLVGLRFASDAELPALAKRALDENLSQKQIKQAINSWRPDYFRI